MVVSKTGSAEVPTDPMPPKLLTFIIMLKPKSEWKTNKGLNKEQWTGSNDDWKTGSDNSASSLKHRKPIQMRFNELMTGVKRMWL